eukprot:TRINITY_DN1889_c0_g3_i2.p1 TRINITY_DN1889_c0_g3~~TRINITY_DN1889_c0_g3_i2.p1  ORF type:complete len:3105 (+),score=724.99 TRINITY_DN1889_c0_g3_i2:159-9473(+)
MKGVLLVVVTLLDVAWGQVTMAPVMAAQTTMTANSVGGDQVVDVVTSGITSVPAMTAADFTCTCQTVGVCNAVTPEPFNVGGQWGLRVRFATMTAGVDALAPGDIDVRCVVNPAGGGAVTGSPNIDFTVSVTPATNQINVGGFPASTTFYEDNDNLLVNPGLTPRSTHGTCGTYLTVTSTNNLGSVGAGPNWETNHPGTPGASDAVEVVPGSCTAVQTGCVSSTGNQCIDDTTIAFTLPGGVGRLQACLRNDAVGSFSVSCQVRDMAGGAGFCCGGGAPVADLCPAALIAHCNNNAFQNVRTVTINVDLLEVNDIPVAAFDNIANLPSIGNPHVWQEDCGLSGYVDDCTNIGAQQPRITGIVVIFQTLSCTNTINAGASGVFGVTMYEPCAVGGGGLVYDAVDANNLQTPAAAISEFQGPGGNQRWIIECGTSVGDAPLFYNGAQGCPCPAGVVPCGCPTLSPPYTDLHWFPARHQVGRATVYCWIRDIHPNPAHGSNFGSADDPRGGPRYRLMATFVVVVAEVNDPPSIELHPTTTQVEPSTALLPEPFSLPRYVFRKDPSWVGPTSGPREANWYGQDPDPTPPCDIVDCCLDDVTVTGLPARPATTPTTANPACANIGKCCSISNFWVTGSTTCVMRNMGTCQQLTGCIWAGGAGCIIRGYGAPEDNPAVNGYVDALPGPPSEGPTTSDNDADMSWGQQWNVKCIATCTTALEPEMVHGPGKCEQDMFTASVHPNTLSNDNINSSPWPVVRTESHMLVFLGSGRPIGIHRRGSVHMRCTQVDEGPPDADTTCPNTVGFNNIDHYISGCRDNAEFDQTGRPCDHYVSGSMCGGNLCTGTATEPLGFPCPGSEIPSYLTRLPDPIEFILEFTAPSYLLSDYPNPDTIFDGAKNPYWEVRVGEDLDPQSIKGYLRSEQVWANGAEIRNMKGTITVVTADRALFSSDPVISNLVPPNSGDLEFTSAPHASGHTWVVVGLVDDGGDAGIINGPAYEEFLIWIEEKNDPPIATVSPAVAPSGRITVNEDSPMFSQILVPDLAAGPKRETDPFPGSAASCPLDRVFPGCGVIPITPAQATAENWNTRPLCDTTCGTGDGCGCGQVVTVTCNPAKPEMFTMTGLPVLDATPGANLGRLTFELEADAAGETEVTCVAIDCDPTTCPKTRDGQDALETLIQFTIVATDINDPPVATLVMPVITVQEDDPQQTRTPLIDIYPGPLSERLAGQQTTLTCSVNPSNLFEPPFTVRQTGTSGQITFKPAKDAAGTAQVECQVADDGQPPMVLSLMSFDIIITEVNDPPSGTLLPSEQHITVIEDSTTFSRQIIVDLVPGPLSEQLIPQGMTSTCTPADTSLFSTGPTVSTSGILTFTPGPDQVGSTVVHCIFVDDGGLSWETSFTVEITEVNDPPTGEINGVRNSPTITVLEDEGAHEEATFLTNLAPGPPSEQLTQSIHFDCTVDQPELFAQKPTISLHGTNGNVHFEPLPDAAGTSSTTCVIIDNGIPERRRTITFDIVITDINDPPVATVTENPVTVQEDAPQVTKLNFLTPFAPGPASESSQTVNSVCTVFPVNLFTINPSITASGTLTFTPAPEKSGTAGVTCTLTDQGPPTPSRSTTVNFDIIIEEVNDPPSVSQAQNIVTVDEDSGLYSSNSHWSSLVAGPQDEVIAGQTVSYTCTYTNPNLFQINGMLQAPPTITRPTPLSTVAALEFQPGPDQAGVSDVKCTLTDDGVPPMTTEVEFQIVVTDVNDPPYAECPSCSAGFNVDEDSGTFTKTGFLENIRAGPATEAAQTLTVICNPSGMSTLWLMDSSVTPPIDGSPSIDPVTGTLTFTPAPDESGSSVVSCTLHDSGEPSIPAGTLALPTFTITVNEVNDKPTGVVTPPGRVSVAVGTPTTFIPGWITDITPGPLQESTQTVTISCVAAIPQLFATTGQPTVNRATGDLSFSAGSTDAEGDSLVTCELVDNGSPPETLVLSFTIAYENQPPTAVVTANVTVAEESGPAQIGSFLSDLSPGPQIEVTNGQSIATITCQPQDTTLFDVSPVISTIGTLEFTPAVDAAGMTRVDCTVSDNGVPQRSVDIWFTVTITDVNDPPQITVNQMTVTATEGGDQTTVRDFATIIVGPPSESNQLIQASCTAADPSLLMSGPTLNVAGWSFANPTAVLEFTPSADRSGMTTATCTVSDNGTPSMSQDITFDIVITEHNDPPTFTLAQTQVTVVEDSVNFEVPNLVINLLPGPPAEVANGETVSVTCTAVNPNLFSVTGRPEIDNTGKLTLTPTPDAVGETDVSCTVTDSGSPPQSDSFTFKVVILEVNDHPIALLPTNTYTVPEDNGPTVVSGFVSPLSPGPESEAAQTIETICVPQDASLFSAPISVASFGANRGELSFTPADDAVGSTQVTCDVFDNGMPPLSTSFTFTVTVTEVNDPPSALLKLTEVSTTEDQDMFSQSGFMYQLKPGPASESSQAIAITCVAANPMLFVQQPRISSAGELSFISAAEESGSTDVTCTLTDNGDPPAGKDYTFKVNIHEANDPPLGTLSTALVKVNEDAATELLDFIVDMAAGPVREVQAGQTFTVSCLAADESFFLQQPAITVQNSGTAGTLTFTPGQDKVGVTDVTCTITDSYVPPATRELSFKIETLEVNDPPTVEMPNSDVIHYQDPVLKQSSYPFFMIVNSGPSSEAGQQSTSTCTATNSHVFKEQPQLLISNTNGTLVYTAKEGISAVNDVVSVVTCTITDNGNPAQQTQVSFNIDFRLPQTPALDTYLESPEWKDSPQYKDESPQAKYLRSDEYLNSPEGKADSPLSKYWETPEGKDSPLYEFFNGNGGGIVRDVLRCRLGMAKSQFSLSRFKDILQRTIKSKTVTDTTVYWVCPDSACPGLVCPSDANSRFQRSCEPGTSFSTTERLLSILQTDPNSEQVIVVDYTVTTTPTPSDFGKSDSQLLTEVQSELATELQNPNSELASLSMQSVEVRPCSDCQTTVAADNDDDGFPWWMWLIIGGAILLCCCLALLIYCCCCRKKKEKEIQREMHYVGSNPSSYSSDDNHHPLPSLTRTTESYSTTNPHTQVTENPMNEFYENKQNPKPRSVVDSEWQPYTIDWGDAGYNDPRPESARQ